MTSHTSFATPTPAEIDRYIAHARQMRSDYIAHSVASAFNRLRTLFSPQRAAIA